MTFQIQAEFDFEPPRSRLGDIDTATAAGCIPIKRLANHRLLAFKALYAAGEDGLSDFELEDRTGIKQTSIGCRRKDLCRLGFVERLVTDAGPVSRKAPSGTPSAVWVLSMDGIAFYERYPS